MSLRLVGRPRNVRKVRINIAFARRSLSLCLVWCLSGWSTVTQEVAGLILATSTNLLCMRQCIRSFCGSYRSQSDTMSGDRQRAFSDARRRGFGRRTNLRHHLREAGKIH